MKVEHLPKNDGDTEFVASPCSNESVCTIYKCSHPHGKISMTKSCRGQNFLSDKAIDISNNNPRQHTAVTKHRTSSFVTSSNASTTSGGGRDANHIHRNTPFTQPFMVTFSNEGLTVWLFLRMQTTLSPADVC